MNKMAVTMLNADRQDKAFWWQLCQLTFHRTQCHFHASLY